MTEYILWQLDLQKVNEIVIRTKSNIKKER